MRMTMRERQAVGRALELAAEHLPLDVLQHTLRVAAKATTPDELALALLHDVVEDTDLDVDDCMLHQSDAVVAGLRLVTRGGETYAEFVERCCTQELARRVKLMDVADHLEQTATLPASLAPRYEKAALRLAEAGEL